ncbi:unnamed protein product, partial [marine sediment metagenome]
FGGDRMSTTMIQICVLVEDATEYSQADITYVEKKRWVDEIAVPGGELWILDNLIMVAESKAIPSSYGKFDFYVDDILITTVNGPTSSTYQAFEHRQTPPTNMIMLKEGSYDCSLEMKVNSNAGKTAYIKNFKMYLTFKRYQGEI